MKHRIIYVFLIVALLTGVLPASEASASSPQASDLNQTVTCDQAALDEAEATFRSRLSENGQIPVDDPITKSAAQLVISLSKKCYDAMQAERNPLNLQGGDPIFIDEGAIDRHAGRAQEYVVSDPVAKWGTSSALGTPGGTVTYSFMGSGLNLSTEGVPSYGSSVAFSALNGFSSCFYTDVQTAFAAWSAVSDIKFVEVADSNTAFDAAGATGDIRIGGHYFDGAYGTLAHAYLPYDYYTGDGDIHFDKDEPWSCSPSGGIDIGLVALHEIGHAIGLDHDDTAAVAVMDPSYNSSLGGLQSDDIAGARTIYGTAPLSVFAPAGNDTIGTATLITGLTYNNDVDTTATTPNSHPNTSGDPEPVSCKDSFGVASSLAGGWSTVWYKYKTPLTVDESIQADTKGTNYDTFVAVFEGDASGNLPNYNNFVDCNDDSLDGTTSRLSFVGAKDTWYYFVVAQYRCSYDELLAYDPENPNGCKPPTSVGGDLKFNVNITNVDVNIGTSFHDSYYMTTGDSRVEKYALDGGPVVINNIAGAKIIASLNQWRARVGITEWTGVTQSMGLPVENVSNVYVMPRYDYSNPTRLYNTILIANVDSVPRDITIKIAGTVMGTYSLGESESQYIKYPGVAGGPVVVSSDTGAKIIASLYELRRDPNYSGWNGQSEMMGLPWEQLSDTYLIPQYFGAANPATLDARLFIANADTVERNITVKIGGVTKGTYLLQPNTGQVLKYLVDGGPVEISGPSGSKIIASLNQWRARVGITEWTGVTQSMALPVENVSNIYVMPRYDYSNPTRLYNTILIANVDNVPRNITIKIDGTVMGTYSLGQSESQYIKYPGVAGGPVVVSSDTGAKIIASLYELRRDPNYSGWNGQSEMMGLPWEQLSDTYLIPQYFGAANPATLDVRLFIAVP